MGGKQTTQRSEQRSRILLGAFCTRRKEQDGRNLSAPIPSARSGLMKLLLTSAGISNASIRHALVDLLGKPIAESSALVIPTAWYAYPGGLAGVYQLMH